MKTTEENNRMIAEFMGITVHELDAPHILEGTKYHTSWGWLVPVASKLYLESRNLDGMNAFRMSHIIQNYQTAVVNNEIAVANHYVLDGINLLNEQKS